MRKIIILLVLIVTLLSISIAASAHPGRTDGAGGHRNSSTGEYHYHHGYSAHDHYDMDGDGDVDCPYGFDNKEHHKDDHSKQSISTKIEKKFSLWNLVSALCSSIGQAFGISLMVSIILVNIFAFLFGDDIGWTVTKIVFILLFTFACYHFFGLNYE